MKWRLSVRVGNLVKINRLAIGIPKGAIGLVVKEYARTVKAGSEPCSIWEVTLYGTPYPMRNRRFLAEDLEVING